MHECFSSSKSKMDRYIGQKRRRRRFVIYVCWHTKKDLVKAKCIRRRLIHVCLLERPFKCIIIMG